MDFLNVDTPPIDFKNSAYGNFTVIGHRENNLQSNIQIPNSSDLNASYTILPHNNAYGRYEILAPPRIVKTFLPVMDSYVRNDARTMNFNGTDLIVGHDNITTMRSFLRFDVTSLPPRLLFTKAILKLKALEISDKFKINIYKVNNFWSEKTITWAGQPIKGELIKSFEVENEINNEIDVKDLVKEWYQNEHENYGIVLQLQDENSTHKVRFGSKEIQGYEPQLEIEYFDPVIPKLKVGVLKSYLNIPEHLDSQLSAEVTLNTKYGIDTLKSNVHIHIPDTLESNIEIQKGTLQSGINIPHEFYILGTISISEKTSYDLLSKINIKRDELYTNLYIPSRKQLPATMNIKRTESKKLHGNINITRDELLSKISISKTDNLMSRISIAKKAENILRGYISIDDITSGSSYIQIDGAISHRHVYFDVNITGHKDLLSNITIGLPKENNLITNINISQLHSELASSITIGLPNYSTLDSNIVIERPHLILSSNITIRNQSFSDLPVSVNIKRDALDTNIIIPHEDVLNTKIIVPTSNQLNANIFIPYRNESILNSNIFINQNKLLYASGFIRSPYLKSDIQIRRNDEKGLVAYIRVRDALPSLLSTIDISAQWSQDLISSVTISGTLKVENKAYGFIF